MDDNFATIVEAIKQGRGIFENIKKTIHYLLSTNIGEILTVLMCFAMRLPPPLLTIQLLWINMATDSLPAVSLGTEPIEPDIMKRKPISPKKSLFSDGLGYNILIEGGFLGAIAFLAFVIGKNFFDVGEVPIIGRTMTFATLCLSQLLHSFNIKSKLSILNTNLFNNIKLIYSFILCTFLQVTVITVPMFSKIFKLQNLNFTQWLMVAMLSITPFLISEIEKIFVKSYNKAPF
jgi:Ca2+-transporting ATPase